MSGSKTETKYLAASATTRCSPLGPSRIINPANFPQVEAPTSYGKSSPQCQKTLRISSYDGMRLWGKSAMQEKLSTVLAERHALLAWLVGRVGQLPNADTRAPCVEHLATALAGHLHSVEHGTNKALRAVLADGIPEHIQQAYATVAHSLAELLVAGESAPDFQDKYLVLAAAVVVMCSIERGFVAPVLFGSLDRPALAQVAMEVERLFDEFVGSTGLTGVAATRLLDESGAASAAASPPATPAPPR